MQASKHANSTQKSPSRLVDSKTGHSCCEAHVKKHKAVSLGRLWGRTISWLGDSYYLDSLLIAPLCRLHQFRARSLVSSCFLSLLQVTLSSVKLSWTDIIISNTCLFQNVDILFNFFIAPHNKDLGVSCVSACVISLTSLRNITGNTVSFRDLVLLLKVQQKIWLVIKNSTYTHAFKTTTEVCVTHGNPGIRCIKMFTCALL